MYMLTYQIPSKRIISAKIEPLKFRTLLLKVSFSRPFQLMKINSTESYVFFLARTYRARIQLSFTNTRGIQYSSYVNPCVSPYRVLNLTLGRNTSTLMNIKIGILNVPKHCNKHDLIHFVTCSHTYRKSQGQAMWRIVLASVYTVLNIAVRPYTWMKEILNTRYVEPPI